MEGGHFAEKVENKKRTWVKEAVIVAVLSTCFTVKHCLMNTLTALLELLNEYLDCHVERGPL